MKKVFVPSRGFLFFYATKIVELLPVHSFRPLTGISLFLCSAKTRAIHCQSFRPLTGISLFLCSRTPKRSGRLSPFSSPHGDFSFSITS